MDTNDVDQQKQRQIARVHEIAVNRDPKLCSYSKEGQFCENLKVSNQTLTAPIACFCEEHQDVPRYILICFNDQLMAENWAREMRLSGEQANVWQKKHVIVGLTIKRSIQMLPLHYHSIYEAQMYEDVLMMAIEGLGLDLSHIVGQKGNRYGY